MRPVVALTIIFALGSCTNPKQAENPLVTVNDGNRSTTWEVKEEIPRGDPPGGLMTETDARAAHACSIQDGAPLKVASIKGLGTEPFWSVQTDGRCVTYSTPEDQVGTRVWTKVFVGTPETAWTGALRGRLFALSIKPNANCSDGMSDKTYPLEAVVRVDGEIRTGCAEMLLSNAIQQH